MQIDFDKIKKIIFDRNFLFIGIFILIDIILVGFSAYIFIQFNSVKEEYTQTETELEDFQTKASLIRKNQSLLDNKIKDYNEALNYLIPDEESYFSVITAFENLEKRTGITVSSYSIDLDKTTEDEFSLNLAIVGDIPSIENLFRSYNFSSQRLLINDAVALNNESITSLDFAVSLVHGKFKSGGINRSVEIKESDINFMDEVLRQMEL